MTATNVQPVNMIDPFGRTITYLRVSVTDRCDLRCFYCMSEDMTFLPKADLLTLEELDRLCSVFIAKGVRKLRLTGGEPLVRRNMMSLVRSLSRHLGSGALDELTLTTNGSLLAKFAGELAAAGVRRINVSLDTLDAGRFRAITRWGDIDKVISGIKAAQAAISVRAASNSTCRFHWFVHGLKANSPSLTSTKRPAAPPVMCGCERRAASSASSRR
jgi:cyclic pyranopterin phosphate synthase